MAVSTVNLKNLTPRYVHEYLFKLDIGIFSMNELGPNVIYSDLKGNRLRRGVDKEYVLQNVALNTILAMGQGHSFCEGVYDIPAGQMRGYRLMVISKKVKDQGSSDPRLNMSNLVTIVFFVPRKVVQFLPHYSLIEDDIFELLSDYDDFSTLIEEDFKYLKLRLLEIISEYCRY